MPSPSTWPCPAEPEPLYPLAFLPFQSSPQQIKAQSPSPECAYPHQTLGRVVPRVFETRPRCSVSQPPALALRVWIQGRPGAAHPSPGRAPAPAASRFLPQGPGVPTPRCSLLQPLALREFSPQLPTASPWGRSQGTLFLLNAKPKRRSFSRRQEQGDQIRRSRKTLLARLQSSLQARMEPQSYGWNRRASVIATLTRCWSPRADGGRSRGWLRLGAPKGDSREGAGGPFLLTHLSHSLSDQSRGSAFKVGLQHWVGSLVFALSRPGSPR